MGRSSAFCPALQCKLHAADSGLPAFPTYPQELEAAPGEKYQASTGQPSWTYQTSVLTVRTFLNK